MEIYRNRFLTFLSSLLMICALSTAATAKTSEVAAAEKRVLNVTTRIMSLLEQNKAVYAKNKNALNAMVRREVLPFIDFKSMSKLTLGKHWRSASNPQRKRFVGAFREMLVRSYATTMLKYTGSKIGNGRSRAGKKSGYVTVRSVVTPNGGSAINASYSVRKVNNDWKAYNVEIAGINLVTNFRTNFTREVSSKGLDALIARLESSNK